MAQDETTHPEDVAKSINDNVRAFLENLTGPSRGRITWLSSDQSRISVGGDRDIRIAPGEGGGDDADARARLTWSGETYEIEAMSDHDLWVNGRKIGTAHLLHGDMIEFGEDGPMSRFRICHERFPTRWPVEEILSDAVAYARTSRRPFRSRLSNALLESTRRLLLETSITFRAMVIIVLMVLTTFVALQYQRDERMEESIAAEAQRLEAIATALAETQEQALTEDELTALRERLDLQLKTNAERLALLERRLGASARVIREATPSVAFLQGAYGLRHVESGKLLRHVLDAEGTPIRNAWGKPLADVDGNGQPVEFQFTGTGFLLKDGGQLVTNRHVALPWETNPRLQAIEQSGFAPELLKLIAYLPGLPNAIEAEYLAASDVSDLALLSVEPDAAADRGLTLSQQSPLVGDEVIVMGFPTGLRALLAQAGREFVSELEENRETDFWTIATHLSEQGRIAPLASRGIIAQITQKTVIYDAETTIGGSGGPALDSQGHVVAVNAAILPEFGGANIGVPVEDVRRLLAVTAGE